MQTSEELSKGTKIEQDRVSPEETQQPGLDRENLFVGDDDEEEEEDISDNRIFTYFLRGK